MALCLIFWEKILYAPLCCWDGRSTWGIFMIKKGKERENGIVEGEVGRWSCKSNIINVRATSILLFFYPSIIL